MQVEYLAGNATLSGSPPTSDERASYQIASHVLVDDHYHESTIVLPALGFFQTDWLQSAVCQTKASSNSVAGELVVCCAKSATAGSA